MSSATQSRNSEGRKLAASPSSIVPPGFIPRGVNFILGGLAGWVLIHLLKSFHISHRECVSVLSFSLYLCLFLSVCFWLCYCCWLCTVALHIEIWQCFASWYSIDAASFCTCCKCRIMAEHSRNAGLAQFAVNSFSLPFSSSLLFNNGVTVGVQGSVKLMQLVKSMQTWNVLQYFGKHCSWLAG